MPVAKRLDPHVPAVAAFRRLHAGGWGRSDGDGGASRGRPACPASRRAPGPGRTVVSRHEVGTGGARRKSLDAEPRPVFRAGRNQLAAATGEFRGAHVRERLPAQFDRNGDLTGKLRIRDTYLSRKSPTHRRASGDKGARGLRRTQGGGGGRVGWGAFLARSLHVEPVGDVSLRVVVVWVPEAGVDLVDELLGQAVECVALALVPAALREGGGGRPPPPSDHRHRKETICPCNKVFESNLPILRGPSALLRFTRTGDAAPRPGDFLNSRDGGLRSGVRGAVSRAVVITL